MQLIDGKIISEQIKLEISREVVQFRAEGGKIPHLAAILVGNDGASDTYVTHKVKDCEQVGFKSTLLRLEANISEKSLIWEIQQINENLDIDGLIVQLPLPGHISESKILEAILPSKDVDGFHPENVGRMVIGLPAFISATPAGILELLRRYKIETSGKKCIVIGRSNIVGKPLSNLLSQKSDTGNATVTLCHSRTLHLEQECLEADIVIAALGSPGFVKGHMVKEGAVVIDVGISRIEATNKSGFKLIGDVDFDSVAPKCSFITPVPGGVGPMTRVALLQNTLLAARKAIYR